MNNLNFGKDNNILNLKNSSKSKSINKSNRITSQNIISKINSNKNINIGETGIKMDIKNENEINKLKTYEKIIEDQKNEIKNLNEKIQQLNN